MKIGKNWLLALTWILCAGGVPQALSQVWPARPVRIIVSSAARSGPDTLTRYLGERLSRAIGQSVIVDNRPGANGVIGAQAGVRAAPDGYTFLLATSSSFSVNRYTIKALPYDPIKDFTPMVLIATGGLAVIAHPNAPIRTLADVVAFDRSQPGTLSVATEGPVAGTILVYVNQSLGTKLLQIPYNSPAQALQDTVAGRTDMSVASIIVSLPFIRRGDVRPIAVVTPMRDASLPDVPAIGESSPGFGVYAWVMFVAPAGTPADIIQRTNGDMDRILKDPEVARWMATFGNRAEGGTVEAASEFLLADSALWGKITQAAGVKPE